MPHFCILIKRQVGNEFSSVEALWSQFENVMAKEPEEGGSGGDTKLEQEKSESQGQGQGQHVQPKTEESE